MKEHTAKVDQVTKVELTSELGAVEWSRRVAAPNALVVLRGETVYVGTSAPVEVQLRDGGGGVVGTAKGTVVAGRFSIPLQVPAKAQRGLVAEVKLPEHGLSGKSVALIVPGPVEVTNARWSAKEARRGDVLTLTADVKGAPDGTPAELTIYEHDADGAHDRITGFEALVRGGRVEAKWEYEYHEDTDDIATEAEAERGYHPPEYFFRVSVHGIFADSELLTFQDFLEIRLTDRHGTPVPGASYVLSLPDGSERRGKLDDHGEATEQDIPPGRVEVRFTDVETNSPIKNARRFA